MSRYFLNASWTLLAITGLATAQVGSSSELDVPASTQVIANAPEANVQVPSNENWDGANDQQRQIRRIPSIAASTDTWSVADQADTVGASLSDTAVDHSSTSLTHDSDSCYAEGEFISFPEEVAPLRWELFEAIPTLLSKPNEPLGEMFANIFHTEHVKVETDLDEHAIGIQPIPPRPQLIVDLNDGFMSPGFLEQGIELPTGAIWRPSLWVFGQSRSGFQYAARDVDPVVEFATRLDLFAQANFTGTERILFGLRPFDEEEFTRREFTGYDFNNGNSVDGLNSEIQTLFFEGDFGEIFPGLDPYDSMLLDYGFSVGRMPLLAQQGLLLNEDMIDAVTVTRNTLNGGGNLNFRATGVYAWNKVNRSSSIAQAMGQPIPASVRDASSEMVAILTESDYLHNTVNFDVAYAYGDQTFGDVLAFGLSGIRRVHGYHNTYNTSIHVLASFPTEETTPFAEQGELIFAQTSWTPHHTEDLIYLNGFLAIDQFTSPARGPLAASPLGQTGILFAHPGLGSTGPPLGVRTNNTAGAILGYQFFFDHTRRQLIWEVGGFKEHEGANNNGAAGTILRYQQAFGQHHILVLDGFVRKRESEDVLPGARIEFLTRF